MTFAEIAKRLEDWHGERFPGDSADGEEETIAWRGVDLHRTLAKLQEECGEIARAVLRHDPDGALEELADVLFLLFHLARGLGGDLLESAKAKLPVIEERLKAKKARLRMVRTEGGSSSPFPSDKSPEPPVEEDEEKPKAAKKKKKRKKDKRK